jgi:RNA methyltransferase, TrmH family
MIKQITSTNNPAIKRLLQLQEKSRTRKKEGVFVAEGQREIELAMKGGYEILEKSIL